MNIFVPAKNELLYIFKMAHKDYLQISPMESSYLVVFGYSIFMYYVGDQIVFEYVIDTDTLNFRHKDSETVESLLQIDISGAKKKYETNDILTINCPDKEQLKILIGQHDLSDQKYAKFSDFIRPFALKFVD